MKSKSEVKPLPKPSVKEVEKYLEYWQTLENYARQEEALNKLLTLLPENKNISDVLLKVSSINDFYSTNIFATYQVAKHIVNIKEVDKRLKQGDKSLVAEVGNVEIQAKDGITERNFYSFATKYCSRHNPEAFPIYDSFVEKMLMCFKGRDKFSNFKRADLKDYPKFKKILSDFQKFYQLEKYSLKQLDCYLWLAGKDFFRKS